MNTARLILAEITIAQLLRKLAMQACSIQVSRVYILSYEQISLCVVLLNPRVHVDTTTLPGTCRFSLHAVRADYTQAGRRC